MNCTDTIERSRGTDKEEPLADVDEQALLARALELSLAFRRSLPHRPVGAPATLEELTAALERPLAEQGEDGLRVLGEMAEACERGLVASAGPRYFGFVVGGSLPASLAADWLVSAWDQDAGLYVLGPAAAVVEDVGGGWLVDLLGLPEGTSVGFVTGGQMANFTGLAAGRHAVLAAANWNVEEDGLAGAPPVTVLVGEEAHVTILSSLRMLGLGGRRAVRVAVDEQGRMKPEALRDALAQVAGPAIVCAQAGNVNSGAFDPLDEIVDLAHQRRAWVHVDGAFGLWAAANPATRPLLRGVEKADSWATDAHKWLNVPYDSGLAFVREPGAHRASLTLRADYLQRGTLAERNPSDWVPESSRRARGVPIYAALRSLGRQGVALLVERCCALARRAAAQLAARPGVRVLNDVVLNQVLVRFEGPGDGDALTRAVIARVQREGTCWLGGTRWRGQEAMRVSVSNWSTTEVDMDRSVAAVLDAFAAESRGERER
jgi:glutamate/tyrosine decarboxylase-like PLP-dependent enzyme